jgi:hypothetical protein
MNAKKIIVTIALLLSATSGALAQSAWTTGTAANREAAGFASPSTGSLYAYEPGFVSHHASGLRALDRIPSGSDGSYAPSATGGGSAGYNWMVEHNY